MPTLVAPDKTTLVKVACICDSGGGKTGALASLVKAGYHLRILDYDNKIAGGILPRVLNPQDSNESSTFLFEIGSLCCREGQPA